MDPQSLRHLHGLRDFVRNLVEQAERSGGCECHRPPSLLLVGPPGAGKTYLVKQMSTVCEMPLFGVHTHQLSGASALQSLFEQAREIDYPSLFFLDDIHCIFSNQDHTPSHGALSESLRRELYAQLGPRKLKIFDPESPRNPVRDSLPLDTSPDLPNGIHTNHDHDHEPPDNNGLILVAATSSPWLLYKDHELLSRFRGVYLVGLPDRETRFHLLKFLLQKIQHNLTEKEFWLIADKTEGFTPSDLMIVTKELNYEQFSFLFRVAGLERFAESSGEETDSSSEMTETDIDSYTDNVGQSSEMSKTNVATRKDPQTCPVEDKRANGTRSPLSSQISDSFSGRRKDTTLTELEKDWSFSEEDEKVGQKQEVIKKSSPEKVEENGCCVAEFGAMSESVHQPEERKDEISPKAAIKTAADTASPSSDLSASETLPTASVGNQCDNRSSVISSAVVNPLPGERRGADVCEGKPRISSDRASSSVSERPSGSNQSTPEALTSSGNGEGATAPPLSSDDDEDGERAFELHLFHPPDSLPNDNQAVDSGSDSDNEGGVGLCGPVGSGVSTGGAGDFSKRSRRVDFLNNVVSAMHPLTVEVDLDHHRLGGSLDNLRGGRNNGPEALTVGFEIDDSIMGKDPFQGTSANTILKRLLSTTADNEEDINLNSKKVLNKELPKDDVYPREDNYLGAVYLPRDEDELIGERGSMSGQEDQTDSCHLLKELNKSKDHPVYPRSPCLRRRNSLNQDNCSLTSVSPQLTPSGSDSSGHAREDNLSESGSGRRVGLVTPIPNRENQDKTRDSNSSLFGKSDTPTIPSSDISTGTCTVSGETLECHSDSDERLRNLEDDLKSRRSSASEDDDEDQDEGEDDDLSADENEALREFLDLNNLGEVSIKILTINDVLNVIKRTARSVSDEEIKRYTDFMRWFANVAKSACPHNSKGALSDTASSIDTSSVNGSVVSASPSTKKRKGPLKKLGRFLLKALMFILD